MLWKLFANNDNEALNERKFRADKSIKIMMMIRRWCSRLAIKMWIEKLFNLRSLRQEADSDVCDIKFRNSFLRAGCWEGKKINQSPIHDTFNYGKQNETTAKKGSQPPCDEFLIEILVISKSVSSAVQPRSGSRQWLHTIIFTFRL